MAALPSTECNKYLSDAEFNRCISYASRVIFRKNENRLINCGFDEEDVRSVTSVYGLEFMAVKPDTKTSKDMYLLMFRFIGQRWTNFFIRLDIKFFNNERLVEYCIGNIDNAFKVPDYTNIQVLDEESFGKDDQKLLAVINGDVDISENYSFREQVAILQEQLQELKLRRSLLTKSGMSKDAADLLKQKLLYRIRALNKKIRTIKARIFEEKRILKGLKVELKNNIDKYAEQLAYLATSKHTSIAVRKNAQTLCRKHAIDYVMWAQDYIQKRDVNPEHFISLK
jgi:hypothetical protein